MIRAVVQVLANAVGLLLADLLLADIRFTGDNVELLIAGLVLGLINLLVKPIVKVLSCPLIVLSLGLFYLVINGAMLMLADMFLDTLEIDGWIPAIAAGALLAVLNWVVRVVFGGARKED